MWIAAVWTSLRLTSHGVCGVVADWRHLCCLESLPWGCSSSLVNYRKWAKKKIHTFFFPSRVVPSTGCAWLFAAPWTGARQASMSFTVSQSLLKLCPLSQWCHATISSSVIPSSVAFSFPQHLGLFQWVSSLHQVAKVLMLQLQHQSFQWIFRVDFL